MRSQRNQRLAAALAADLYLLAWLALYGVLPNLLGAGYADARRVLIEAAAALPLLALAARDGPLPAPEGRGKPRYALIAAVLALAFLAAYAAGEAFCLAGSVRYEGDPAELFRPGMLRWYALRTCATAPLMEELGCRWIAFGKLRRGFGFWPSALASAAMFSLIHVGVHPDLPLAVVPGALLYCLLYELTGTPWCGVAAHAAHMPGTAWSRSELEGLLFGVPRSVSVPALLAVAAVAVLLCAFRDKVFRRVPPADA